MSLALKKTKSILNKFLSAVQHERGPRKPKFRDSSDLKSSNYPNSGISISNSSYNKAISAIERHHHHHHHSIMSKIPPPLISSSSSSNNSERNEMLSGLFNKSDSCHLGSINSSIGHTTFFEAQTPPPGLLQMLLNAEKSQELIWNSIRSGNIIGHIPSTANMPPFGGMTSRLFDEINSQQNSFMISPFISNGNNSCSLLIPPPHPPPPSSTPSSTATTSEPHTPESEIKSITNTSRGFTPLPLGIPFPKPLQPSTSSQWDSVHEVTARLLFMVIRWVKCLPTYRTLSKGDQVIRKRINYDKLTFYVTF